MKFIYPPSRINFDEKLTKCQNKRYNADYKMQVGYFWRGNGIPGTKYDFDHLEKLLQQKFCQHESVCAVQSYTS